MNKRKSPTAAKGRKSQAETRNTAPDTTPEVPIQDVVDAIFQSDSAVREVIAGNMKERSDKARTFTARAQDAFAGFKPTKYPSYARPLPNYVKPGESPTPTQNEVITRGLEAFRNSAKPRSLKLAKSAGLDRLVNAAPANDESIVGTIALSDLVSYIESKSGGRDFVARDTVFTTCKAEIEAERRIKEIEAPNAPPPRAAIDGNGLDETAGGITNTDGTAAADLTAAGLVKENVELQMGTATSPESQLRYSVPDRSKQITNVHKSIETFELRSGPSDVTSFHDFHNLQIAFEDVWTEMFDAQLADLGKQLYEEYVRLKSVTGVDDGQSHTINTIDDLRRLMDEIRDFSRLTEVSIPAQLQPRPEKGGGSTPNSGIGSIGNVGNIGNTGSPVDVAVDVVRTILDLPGTILKILF